jgi:signal transduction histidine kinase
MADTRLVRVMMIGLLVTNLLATAITVWIMVEVRKEQVVFADILQELRKDSGDLVSSTQELSYELRWQYGLTILVLLNIIATGLALAALSRAYLLSQRSLRNVKELAANILASMDHAVLTLDSAGKLNGINPKCSDLLGIQTQHLQLPLAELGSDLEPLVELSREIQESGQTIRDRAFQFAERGQPLRLLSHGYPLKDNQGTRIGVVLHVVDVTRQSLLEERMRRMERFAGLGAVAAGLAHEIKNPLSALALHVQLLKEQIEHAPIPETDETIQILLAEVHRMTRVLDGFREFAAIDRLDRNPASLPALIQKVVRLLKPHIQSKGIKLKLDLGESANHFVDVDSVKIEQVLINLVLNALEAMPANGVLSIRCEVDEGEARVFVADTGTGIPSAIRDRLFDPYFTTKNQGTGLGLAICEKIVRQHEGTITFQTSEQGTTFQLTLPLKPLTDSTDRPMRILNCD